MEREVFISGYCRVMDQSRIVAAFIVDENLEEVDCCFGACPHEPNCTVAAQIRELMKNGAE